jgi:hypothetical protein
MSDAGTLTLAKTRLIEGAWEGVLTGASGDEPPDLSVTHFETPVDGVTLDKLPDGSGWRVRVPIPPEVISDGVQTFVIRAAGSEETLDSFSILAGEALSEDIRAEIELLRAELDMLKRAFRRHCLETM